MEITEFKRRKYNPNIGIKNSNTLFNRVKEGIDNKIKEKIKKSVIENIDEFAYPVLKHILLNSFKKIVHTKLEFDKMLGETAEAVHEYVCDLLLRFLF